MNNIKSFRLKLINKNKIGHILFLTGIFSLCSSLFIGYIFLLPAFIIGSFIKSKEENYFKDKWNLSFFLCGILMIISSVLQNFVLKNSYIGEFDPKSSFLGLFNWLPFFWIFWASQPYLDNSQKIRSFALVMISGTFPLLITGFGQYFLGWTGPFKSLDGLVVWYLKPLYGGGLSGLFSNQNYAASWLNFIWPLCIALVFEKLNNIIKKSISITFFLSIGIAAFLTYSRSSIGGLFLVIPIVIGQESLVWIIPIILFLFLIIILSITPIISLELQAFIQNLIPSKFFYQFSQESFQSLDITRKEIWASAISIMRLRPWFGIGSGAFTAIFLLEKNLYKGHSHNLITELAISYGIPVSLIFMSNIALLLIFSAKIIFFQTKNSGNINYYERAFWASIFFFALSQTVDIQYFDGRISTLSWLLIALIRNIVAEDRELKSSK